MKWLVIPLNCLGFIILLNLLNVRISKLERDIRFMSLKREVSSILDKKESEDLTKRLNEIQNKTSAFQKLLIEYLKSPKSEPAKEEPINETAVF